MNEAQYRWSLENRKPRRRAVTALSSKPEYGLLRHVTQRSRRFQRILEAWNEVVYAPLQRVAQPTEVNNDTLTIAVQDGAAAERMRREAGKLLGLLRERVNGVARLRVLTQAELRLEEETGETGPRQGDE